MLSVTLIDLNMYIAFIRSDSKPMEILLLLVAKTLNHGDIVIFIHRSQNALQVSLFIMPVSILVHIYLCKYIYTPLYVYSYHLHIRTYIFTKYKQGGGRYSNTSLCTFQLSLGGINDLVFTVPERGIKTTTYIFQGVLHSVSMMRVPFQCSEFKWFPLC